MKLLTRAIVTVLFLGPALPQEREAPLPLHGDPIRVRTDLVELFLTVQHRGRPVTGLTPADFLVTDDGRVQELAYLDTEESSLRVVMLLDTSFSMTHDLAFLEAAALRFLSTLRTGDEVGLFSFGGSIRELARTTGDLERVRTALSGMQAVGNTPLFDAIARGVTELREPGIRRGIVLFTDGDDTASRLSKEHVARLCGRSAIPLFIIGAGEAVRDNRLKNLLEDLAGASGGEAFFAQEPKDLTRAFGAVSVRLRSGYGAGYYAGSPPDERWHRIRVELRGKKGKVTAREGYYAD